MGKIMTLREQNAEVKRFIMTRRDTFAALGATPEKLVSLVTTELSQSPYLAKVAAQNPLSLYGAILKASQLGLEVGSHLGHAYIVPRGGKNPAVGLVVGYKGIVYLLYRDSQIVAESVAVYDGDGWKYSRGLSPVLEHEPRFESKSSTHFYAIAELPDGRKRFDVMGRDEIEAIRDNVTKWQATPWAQHFDEMARKTVLKRLAKQLPISPNAQAAITADDAVDANLDQHLHATVEVIAEQPDAEETASGPVIDNTPGAEPPGDEYGWDMSSTGDAA